VRIGIVEFTVEEPVPADSIGGTVVWRSTPREVRTVLSEAPVDAIVFHVQLDESDDLVGTLHEIKVERPEVKMLLAGSSSHVLILSEITSITFSQAGLMPGTDLSPRQVQVLIAIRAGRTNREIANLLGISLSTVNRHVENILQKLPARNRAHAAAIRIGRMPEVRPPIAAEHIDS
jgi:DNA-binding CsgD family transcriptional regulator